MSCSTTGANGCLDIRVRDLRPHNRARVGNRTMPRSGSSTLGDLSSQAGLECRSWLARLRRAIREDLFVLHYQPIVSLSGDGVVHYEALIRLADDPDGHLDLPNSFIPAAERHGLIGEIDRLVVSKVAALLGRELWASDARVAVNLSALSITDSGMLAHIEREIVRRRIDPARLIFEVTETAAVGDMAQAIELCEAIQRMGSAIALDDFGAGFASFRYLKHLPFSYLKIDGELIRELSSSRTDQLVVKALVDVARAMGKRTIAEYVDDESTMEMLRAYGVDYAQGFHLGRPVHEMEAFASIG